MSWIVKLCLLNSNSTLHTPLSTLSIGSRILIIIKHCLEGKIILISYIIQFISGKLEFYEIAIYVCALAFIVICCFPVHESAHAWMASKLGDDTGRLSGRISLSPKAHLDLFGTLMIVLFGFGYAKPVPVNIRNFPPKKRKLYFALVAVAGPVSNLILAIFFSLLKNATNAIYVNVSAFPESIAIAAYTFFAYASMINVSLAVFNFIPIPPLDGSRVLTAILPDRIYYKIMQYERYSMYILFAIIFICDRLNFSPLSTLTSWVCTGIDFICRLPFAAFL